MSEAKTVSTMRLLGGHPALDFVNTVDSRRDGWGPDLLERPSDLVAFGKRMGLVDGAQAARLQALAEAEAAAAERALARAKTVREALAEVFQAESTERKPDADAVATMREAAAAAGASRRLKVTPNGFEWGWDGNQNLDAVADRFAFAAAELLVSRVSRRPVRECTAPGCGWLFLDTSRGGKRRWCAEDPCGTQVRVRRFRQKKHPAA